jgi:hypothetical protein
MKFIRLIAISGIVIFLSACGRDAGLLMVNSESFNDKQITLGNSLTARVLVDSATRFQESTALSKNLDEAISSLENVRQSKSDSSWSSLLKNWEKIKNNPDLNLDSAAIELSVFSSWTDLNSRLLKFSEQVKFGDELEKLLYKPAVPVLSERLLKSVIYTHIDDQIFINLFGSSSLVHNHTTGGIIKIIQQTDYPSGNEITLKCECSDTRYLDVFIRIPEWAVNPTVTHGNVKYVARPGEYCQISRKWRDGDEIKIVLKN